MGHPAFASQVSSEKQFQIAIRSFSEDDKLAAILHVIQVGQWVLAKVMEYVPGQPKPLRFTCSLRDVSQLDGSDFMQQDKAQLKDGAAGVRDEPVSMHSRVIPESEPPVEICLLSRHDSWLA